jgi:hypothetical protein
MFVFVQKYNNAMRDFASTKKKRDGMKSAKMVAG